MLSKLYSNLTKTKNSQSGFTVIELVLVLVIIGILLAIIFTAYTSVHTNQNNQARENSIDKIYKNLEAYYVDNSQYPTLSYMNSATWLTKNMPNLNPATLKDPAGKTETLVAIPKANFYAYEVTAADGGVCDNVARICQHYTLVASLIKNSSKTYIKSSLN